MATRPKFAKMANYSRECVECESHFGECRRMYRVSNVLSPGKVVGECRSNVSSPGKVVGECGRMYRVRAKGLANVGRMYRVRTK
jgi:hypothetical protein